MIQKINPGGKFGESCSLTLFKLEPTLSMTREERWNESRQYYQELVEKYQLHQEPMIDIIDQLKAAGLCEKFYPSNSHEALGLSTVEEYSERRKKNMVYIIYKPRLEKFEIVYQSGQGNTVHSELCEQRDISSKFRSVEIWLLQH